MKGLDGVFGCFMVFIIIAFIFLLWNIYCDYKKLKKMKKIKNIEKMTREQFLERIERKYTNKGGLIKEIESYLDDSGNEVLYVNIGPQMM